nr:MAG TPA: hypothetical protein [Caudoviricetes sp.]
MKIVAPKVNGRTVPNCLFIEDADGTKHCISYMSDVAKLTPEGVYIEMQGDKYFSKTSNRHKNLFKKHYNIGV